MVKILLVEDKALAAACDDSDTRPVDLPRLLEKINTLLNTNQEDYL